MYTYWKGSGKVELHPVIKKLQWKNEDKPVLVLNPPAAYKEVQGSFTGEVHHEAEVDEYEFVQAFGTSNVELKAYALEGLKGLKEGGLFWLCYPKKSSKIYRESNCSRETVATLLADEGYEPVRQIAIDEDWSALRFRKADEIKRKNR
ncbi:DUF3052 domain-containing protein [Bacillus marinisedimentorum]|uniref:DUF3052 domain-containing protein n=1 Tax=Bacillus marinisedimentorum TaxID=1821260 RepID=UPI0007DEEE2B